MVKIRLQRFGAHKAPQYRLVACDSRNARDAKFIEILGTYNPSTNPASVNVNEEKVLAWLNKGAQVSDTCKNLLSDLGIIAKFASSKVKPAAKAKTTKAKKSTK